MSSPVHWLSYIVLRIGLCTPFKAFYRDTHDIMLECEDVTHILTATLLILKQDGVYVQHA
ncbi:hypothetical protein [Anaplasma phagocytophilum]|uniref:hypothetical protein n=1 Tax=Anaplasma phagocytophilum TaxID=948 RepID=UPI00200FAD22|nr:hypothetical protein [Anaplasma phagocytophilum]UQD54336.1 hypothetical protein ESP60_02940 [Anaplasma phagocytophilum]